MPHSRALYRPSILELARQGNFRAIGYWINSLLGPYGIFVQTTITPSGCINIVLDFQQPRPREFCIGLRHQLVQFICYRLWTLNSNAIRDVRIVARVAGEPTILWRQSVRIVTPANRERSCQSYYLRTMTRRGTAWVRFQMLRSIFVSRLTIASFFLCYWLLYWKISGHLAFEQSSEVFTLNAAEAAQVSTSSHNQSAQQSVSTNAALVSVTANPSKSLDSPTPTATDAVPETFQGKVVHQVDLETPEKVVALTFDDGPWPNHSEQVLDILKQYNIKATFFWVGLHIQQHPDVAKKVAAAGHAIGNHTWRHVMDDVDEVTAAQEVGNTARLIYETTGVRTQLFRPPAGNINGSLVPYAQQQKNAIALWSADSEDYYVSAPIIVDNVLSSIKPGGIVLMHDGGGDRTATIEALPQIILTLQQQGYRFVTVPELLRLQGKQTVAERSHPEEKGLQKEN